MPTLFLRFAGPSRSQDVLRLSLRYDILGTYSAEREVHVAVHAELWHDDPPNTGLFHPPGIPDVRLVFGGLRDYFEDKLNPCTGLCIAELTRIVLVDFNDTGPKLKKMFASACKIRTIEVHESETGVALLKLLVQDHTRPTGNVFFPALETLLLLEDRDNETSSSRESSVSDMGENDWALENNVPLLKQCLDERLECGLAIRTLGLPRRHAEATWVKDVVERVECLRFFS